MCLTNVSFRNLTLIKMFYCVDVGGALVPRSPVTAVQRKCIMVTDLLPTG